MAFGSDFSEKLTHLMAATVVCGGVAATAPQLGPLALVEALLGIAALGHFFVRQRFVRAETILQRCATQIEKCSDALLANEIRDDREAWVARRDDAVAAIKEIVPLIVPKAEELVAERLNERRVAAFYLKRAAVARPEQFGDTTSNYTTRQLFEDVIVGAYRVITKQPEFAAELLQRGLADLLQAQDHIEETVQKGFGDLSAQISDLTTMFAAQIAATTNEYRLPRNAVDRLLFSTIGLGQVEQSRIPEAFDEVARRFAAMRDIFQEQPSDDPEIATLKERMTAALANADLDAAERLLGAVRARQGTLSERRRRSVNESLAHLVSTLREEAKICAQQADAALMRFDTATALRFCYEGIALLVEVPVEIRRRYALQVADSMEEFGDRTGNNEAILASIDLYGIALNAADRGIAPLEWGKTQKRLGNALATLGRRGAETTRLEEAVNAYRAALEELTRERVPAEWARTQDDLGRVLVTLAARGQKGTEKARLEEAVKAYRAALEEFTRERLPLNWALTQGRLAFALLRFDQSFRELAARLEEAVNACRGALGELTRECAPLDWARTQNTLGKALITINLIKGGTDLEEAANAHRAALEALPRERMPLEWAGTQGSLGNALAALGEREAGTTRLEEAVNAYRAALEELTQERVPLDWAQTQTNLGNALFRLAERICAT